MQIVWFLENYSGNFFKTNVSAATADKGKNRDYKSVVI